MPAIQAVLSRSHNLPYKQSFPGYITCHTNTVLSRSHSVPYKRSPCYTDTVLSRSQHKIHVVFSQQSLSGHTPQSQSFLSPTICHTNTESFPCHTTCHTSPFSVTQRDVHSPFRVKQERAYTVLSRSHKSGPTLSFFSHHNLPWAVLSRWHKSVPYFLSHTVSCYTLTVPSLPRHTCHTSRVCLTQHFSFQLLLFIILYTHFFKYWPRVISQEF